MCILHTKTRRFFVREGFLLRHMHKKKPARSNERADFKRAGTPGG